MFSIIFCIVLGSALIIAQILSVAGNMKAGGLNLFQNVTNFGGFLFELFYFLGYFLFGFIGLYILIVAIKEYRKLKSDNENNRQKKKHHKRKRRRRR